MIHMRKNATNMSENEPTCRCAKAERRQTMQHSRAVCTSTLHWQLMTKAMALELGGAEVLKTNAGQGLEAINSDISNAVILHDWNDETNRPEARRSCTVTHPTGTLMVWNVSLRPGWPWMPWTMKA